VDPRAGLDDREVGDRIPDPSVVQPVASRYTDCANPLYPRYPLNKRLGEPQNQSGRYAEETKFFPLPGIEPRPSSR
jgi:hypothetical protein